jgi:hypothetical protein
MTAKSAAVAQPELLPAESLAPQADHYGLTPATPPPADEWMAMLERLASNPAVDLTKIEKLIDLRDRVAATEAEAAFNAAYARMQTELPEITEKGKIIADGKFRSSYATFEDIMRAVRPIMGRHGFGIRFEHTTDGTRQRCTGILSHAAGHSIRDVFEALPDSGGNKPAIQANGSTRSYGQRYTLIALLGIATRGQDDDGQTSQAPDAPEGFDPWFAALQSLATEGWGALGDAWNKSRPDLKNYITRHRVADWNALKAQAQKVDKAAGRG